MNDNAALYFVDRHIEEGRSDKVAFREADGAKRSLTYGQLAQEAARFGGALERHGVRREERVAMICLVPSLLPLAYFPVQAAQTPTSLVYMAPIRPLPVMVTSIRSAISQIPAWKYVWPQRLMPISAGLPVPMLPTSSVKWLLPMVPTQAMASCVSPMFQLLALIQPI